MTTDGHAPSGSLGEADVRALEAARRELADPPVPLPRRIRLGPAGLTVSALSWRKGAPELVLLHGGFENAHAWDLLALALDRPLCALDLPGCGRSSRSERGLYWPPDMNALLAPAVRELAAEPVTLVGLSFGGLVALSLLAEIPESVAGVVLVDVLPGSARAHSQRVVEWLRGPPQPASLTELERRWAGLHPVRSESFLREQIRASHVGPEDALLPDADCRLERWTPAPSFDWLWEGMAAARVPISLVRGRRSKVVTDADVERFREIRADARVYELDSGHHVPLHAPHELAELLGRPDGPGRRP